VRRTTGWRSGDTLRAGRPWIGDGIVVHEQDVLRGWPLFGEEMPTVAVTLEVKDSGEEQMLQRCHVGVLSGVIMTCDFD
jgi:hypothetical protein